MSLYGGVLKKKSFIFGFQNKFNIALLQIFYIICHWNQGVACLILVVFLEKMLKWITNPKNEYGSGSCGFRELINLFIEFYTDYEVYEEPNPAEWPAMKYVRKLSRFRNGIAHFEDVLKLVVGLKDDKYQKHILSFLHVFFAIFEALNAKEEEFYYTEWSLHRYQPDDEDYDPRVCLSFLTRFFLCDFLHSIFRIVLFY